MIIKDVVYLNIWNTYFTNRKVDDDNIRLQFPSMMQ